MRNDDLQHCWNNDEPFTDDLREAFPVPAWIDQDISPATIAGILQGGCESGAYMPAVAYCDALDTMGRHGDQVTQFIDDHDDMDEVFRNVPESNRTWSGMAVYLLSAAVELWALRVVDRLESHLAEEAEEHRHAA